MNGTDIRVIQRGSGLRFFDKPVAAFFVSHQLGGKNFDGHMAEQARILGFIDYAHAAFPNLLKDLVMGEGLADHEHTSIFVGPGCKKQS
jgi:hypothetical protein